MESFRQIAARLFIFLTSREVRQDTSLSATSAEARWRVTPSLVDNVMLEQCRFTQVSLDETLKFYVSSL